MIEIGSSVWWAGKYWTVEKVNLWRGDSIRSIDVNHTDKDGNCETVRIEISDLLCEDDET